MLNDRATDLLTAYQRRRRLPDLEQAVEYLRAALAALPPHFAEERSIVVGNLGGALRELYERTRNADTLAEAEAVGRAALEPDGPADPNRLIKLGTLAAVLHTRYEIVSEPRILDEEISLLQEAVRLARPDHPVLGGYLSNLTHALHSRLQLPLNNADTDTDAGELSGQMVEYAREAVTKLPPDDRGRARAVLALALRTRFEVTNNLAFLWEAADVARAAIAEMPRGHVARPAVLSNMGAILRSVHEHTDAEAPLSEAIGYLREAVQSSDPNEHNRVTYLVNLANALTQLWSATGETALLADASAALNEALRAAGPDDIRRAPTLTTLVLTMLNLAERMADPAILQVAANAARAAIALTPDGHRDRALRLSNLAVVLGKQADRTGDEADSVRLLREAVEAARDAATARSDPSARAKARTNLAAMLQDLGERTAELAAPHDATESARAILREAAEVARVAVNDLPPGHPFAFACRVNFAATLWSLAKLADGDERQAAFRRSLRIHRDVADAADAPTSLRIRCHRAVARLLSSPLAAAASASPTAPNPRAEALSAIEAIVDLLPQAVAPHLPRADREYAASLLAGLPAQAAAVAANAGLPERAVELAEHTRGLIVAEALDARSGQFARARQNPKARGRVNRLDDLRRRLSALERDADLNLGRFEPDRVARGERSRVETETATRDQLQAEWASLVDEVRRIDGLEDFLKPPTLASLLPAAEGGHLVYVYADEERCDALVVSPDQDPAVRLIPLPNADPQTLVNRVQGFRDALDRARDPRARRAAADAADRELLEHLAWTWDAITEPVMSSIGITTSAPANLTPDGPTSAGNAPRIWWCPIGLLTQLPLHAAGHHAPDSDRSVLDRVTPSYVPSARALLAARSNPASTDVTGTNTLIVAVPNVPGLPELAGAEGEAELIERLCGTEAGNSSGDDKGTATAHRLPNPRRQTVLAALPDYPIVHFACHGEGDAIDPARGRLILTDHETAPLIIGEINRLTLSAAALAYLSACETTVTSLRLADEAVHLTAAFHLAGYRRVVGTLWEADDAVAYDIAERFYERITAGGTTAPNVDDSAHALRTAVLAVRQLQRYGSPSLWSGYVHFGA